MTTPSNDLCDVRNETLEERVVPQIEKEEDVPFPSGTELVAQSVSKPVKPMDQKLGQTDDLDKEITRFRFSTGRIVLFVAMAAMAVMVGVDILVSHFWETSSDLVESAFEAFKLITMTVLGYIFGSNSSK